MTNSFHLDRANGKFLGVCSGIQNHLGIDALLVRIAFVGSVLLGFGLPLILYFVIALLAN